VICLNKDEAETEPRNGLLRPLFAGCGIRFLES
jgi:hypothetical protein